MYILGINAYHGDAAACIFKDNKNLAAAEEEGLLELSIQLVFLSKPLNFVLIWPRYR
tara:strand:+ start:21 stop:191 length:171 start_codon:yes stop_codon:yes gene_type:complete